MADETKKQERMTTKKNNCFDSVLLEKLKNYSPRSVFIFGSRARGDYHKDSDYEIGVIFNDHSYISKEKLDALISPSSNVRLYPYSYNAFLRGKTEVPFPPNMFLGEIILTGKTIYGERIIETIPLPPITVTDLVEEINFSIARASDAIVLYQNDNRKITRVLFWKSCLFGTRVLILLSLKRFPRDYTEILRLGSKVASKEQVKIIETAYQARNTKIHLSLNMLFQNLFYLVSIREMVYCCKKRRMRSIKIKRHNINKKGGQT